MSEQQNVILLLIDKHHQHLLTEWLTCQKRVLRGADAGLGVETDELSRRFLTELRRGVEIAQFDDIHTPEWQPVRELLEDMSRNRAIQGFTPSETATFVFSLKEPLFALLRQEVGDDVDRLASETWITSLLIDRLGLYTIECYAKTREQVITRQQTELLDLSTPVVELWEGILALPLIGTLDSSRTQIVMESLLQRIVNSRAQIAIIDITGVPTVDTMVAQHLIKTISAARLMGADCILSGIRPQIAQTIVHLGPELNVISKATMADALALALRRSAKSLPSWQYRVKREGDCLERTVSQGCYRPASTDARSTGTRQRRVSAGPASIVFQH
jgi:rsbT co-antagonist protein RsbR